MMSTIRTASGRPSVWRTSLAVVGAVTAGYLGGKLLRQALLWAQMTLLPPNVRKYSGEWALVTGGSEGIGKSVAAELAGHGLHIVLVSISQMKMWAAAEDILSKHPTAQVLIYAADLTDTSSCSKLLSYLSDNNIHVSVLIANAGLLPNPNPRRQSYWEVSEFEESQISVLNSQACCKLIRGLVPGMAIAGKGAIVCVSSIVHRVNEYTLPYFRELLQRRRAIALCRALDFEVDDTGVTVQAMVLEFIQPAAAAAATAAAPVARGGAGTASVSALQPSYQTAAAAVVRCIGRFGPVVSPCWGRRETESLMLNSLLLFGLMFDIGKWLLDIKQ